MPKGFEAQEGGPAYVPSAVSSSVPLGRPTERLVETRDLRRSFGADAGNRTPDPFITSRPRPCLWCPFGLHTASYSATISTVSHRHVGKMSAGKGTPTRCAAAIA